ncbi:MAG: RDD family protein [Verrucomicrobiota bacterium]
MSDSPIRYAGFWIRGLAHIIDSIIITVLLVPVILLVYRDEIRSYAAPSDSGALSSAYALDRVLSSPLGYVLQYGLPAIAIILLWKAKSATPGKMLLRIVITDTEGNRKLSMKQCVVRYLGYAIPMVPFFFFAAAKAFESSVFFALGLVFLPLTLCFFWIIWDRQKQGWHDKLARTLVIYSD